MPVSNKYSAEKVTADGVTFDSKFEYSVYRMLATDFPTLQVEIHKPIAVKPSTPHFPARYWKADFYLPQLNWIIEAKGVRTRDWLRQLELLDCHNPQLLQNLSVVSQARGEKVFKGCKTITIADLKQLILLAIHCKK